MAKMVEHHYFIKVKGGKYKAVDLEIKKLTKDEQRKLLKTINAF